MALAIDVMDGRGLSNIAHHEHLLKEIKAVLYYIVDVAVLVAKPYMTEHFSVQRCVGVPYR